MQVTLLVGNWILQGWKVILVQFDLVISFGFVNNFLRPALGTIKLIDLLWGWCLQIHAAFSL